MVSPEPVDFRRPGPDARFRRRARSAPALRSAQASPVRPVASASPPKLTLDALESRAQPAVKLASLAAFQVETTGGILDRGGLSRPTSAP